MADDDAEPSLTRWTFQDFEMIYDAKFGRKRMMPETQNGETTDRASINKSSGWGVTTSASMNGENSSDLAVYEQFRNQRSSLMHSSGVLPRPTDEMKQRSLLPLFESADMRILAESLSHVHVGISFVEVQMLGGKASKV